MIKPVSVMNSIVKTPAVRNFATATMLTLGVLGVGACAGGSANKTTEQVQTEILSAEGAEALKAMNVETPLYSNEINKQVYDKTLSICPKDQVESVKEALKKSFEVAGTFLGTADAQRVVDMNLIGNFKNIALDKFDSGMHITILEQVNKKSTALMNQIRQTEAEEFAKNGFPSAQDMSKRLDDTFNNLEFVTDKQKRIYNKSILAFQKGQSVSQKSNVQKMSDLIAYKAFLIDKAIIEHYIEYYMVFQEGPTRAMSNMSKKDYKEMVAEFEKAAAPTP